jgi:hypothetical protein
MEGAALADEDSATGASVDVASAGSGAAGKIVGNLLVAVTLG